MGHIISATSVEDFLGEQSIRLSFFMIYLALALAHRGDAESH